MNEYDVGKAFAAIEEELIASMMRNMQRHRDWEDAEGFSWSMWQAEQLKALNRYKRANKKKFQRQFGEINGSIGRIIEQARKQGNMEQELEILDAIKNGWKAPKKLNKSVQTSAEFFKLNTRKLEALIKATEHDFKKAEVAVLRRAEDQYRQVIFNAQVYANTGAGTYEKAVDMATKDFLAAGINCIEYANGARHTIQDYADMAIRTAAKRAYLTGEGEKRQEWGISTVIMNKRGNPCPKCLPFVGKIMIDDVWSGGKASDGPYPLMSSAIAAGLYHPRCKDSHSTYFPGITTAEDRWTKEELAAIEKANKEDAQRQYAKRQAEKYDRLSKYSLDEQNRKMYAARATSYAKQWKAGENGSIIKNIDIDDMEALAYGKDIDKDVIETIYDALKQGERNGDYFISEVAIKSILSPDGGMVLLQIEPIPAGNTALLRLNINQDAFAGKTLDEINEAIKQSRNTVIENLEEAAIHERGHAKTIQGLSINAIEELYKELEGKGIGSISRLAKLDGAEALAEIEVLLSRGDYISDEAEALYNKYIRRRDK